jgi:pimeloyl-ACP methyl ester carboxylesterase
MRRAVPSAASTWPCGSARTISTASAAGSSLSPHSLVVWGDDDKIMPPANAALWRERLPDARLVMMGGCGHLPHVEHAALVARHVRDFLEGVAP